MNDIESHIIQQVTSSLTQAINNQNHETKETLEDIKSMVDNRDTTNDKAQFRYENLENEYEVLKIKYESLKRVRYNNSEIK